jgi:hypothetical protein
MFGYSKGFYTFRCLHSSRGYISPIGASMLTIMSAAPLSDDRVQLP